MPLSLILLVAAPFIGSFLGVVITREADFASIARGRSRCDHCGTALGPLELAPIVSWIVQRARCRHCGAPLSWFFPAVEFIAIVPVGWALLYQSGWTLFISALFGWFLIALAWIDWRTLRLPDALTYLLLLLGLAAAWYFDRTRWLDHAIGAAGAFAVFAALTFGYRILRGREGLGLGDAKFAAALGAWVAWEGMPTTVFLAATLALAAILIRRLFGRRVAATERIPFGPFLAAAAWITWLYGPLMPGWQ